MTGDLDDRVIWDLARELASARPLALDLSPAASLELAGLVQLALRHPSVPPTARACADRYLAAMRQHFADRPTVLEVLRQGDRRC